MDEKRIQCWSNASPHIPIYLQPFLKYSDISVASDWFNDFQQSREENERFYHILLSPGYAPGTIAVNITRMERGFNACKTLRAYTQPFLRYSKLLVENCDIFIPHLCLAVPQGVTPSEFREDLDIHKTRINGLSWGEESMTICSAVLIK